MGPAIFFCLSLLQRYHREELAYLHERVSLKFVLDFMAETGSFGHDEVKYYQFFMKTWRAKNQN